MLRHGMLAFAFAVVALAAGSSHAPDGANDSGAAAGAAVFSATLTGTVTYLQRIALPDDAEKVDERMSYAVSACITVGGKLAWISDTHTPALTRGAAKKAIDVRLVPAGG